MYIEIILVGVIVMFILIYTGTISTSKFFKENKGLFTLLQEKDYEFLLRAKYGERVYDVSQVFRKRVFQGLITTTVIIFVFLSNLKALYLLIAVAIGYFVFKSQYMDLDDITFWFFSTVFSFIVQLVSLNPHPQSTTKADYSLGCGHLFYAYVLHL